MANREHLAILLQGVQAWNKWRAENPRITPDLVRADLSLSEFPGIQLWGANLYGAKLDGTNLENAMFWGSDLRDTSFRSSNLERANIRRANLRRADFSDANLRGSIFMEADLENAKFPRAYLSHAQFQSARMRFISELDLTQQQIDNAYGDGSTLLPDHLERPTHWSNSSASTDQIDKVPLIPPTRIHFDAKATIIDREPRQTESTDYVPRFRDGLIADQAEVAGEIADTIGTGGNILPRQVGDAARNYQMECLRGAERLAPIKLERLYKQLRLGIDGQEPNLLPTGLRDLWHVFSEHHFQLEECFAELADLRKAVTLSSVPASGIPKDRLSSLQSAIHTEAVSDIVRDDIETELAQPDADDAGGPNDEKSYGLGAYAVRLWNLATRALQSLERTTKAYTTFKTFAEMLRPIIRWIRDHWSQLSEWIRDFTDLS